MEPITREEYYLAKIAGTLQGKTPEPVTIEEYYLATMAGDYSGNTPQPVTRLQYYMAKAAGVWGGSIPAPVTRLEYYWAAIANGEGTVFQPVTREEHFLALVADAYSVVITVVTGNPALLEGVKGSRFTALALHGKSTQGSTTGAQLFDFENAMQKIIGNWTTTNILSAEDTNDIFVNWQHLEGIAQTYIAIVSRFKFEANKTIYIAKKIGTRILIYDENGKNREILTVQSYTPTESFNGYIGVGIDKETKVDGSLIFSYDHDFSTAEPYTGGAPSPSPSYPQEIESAGQSGEIGIEVGNNGYIQKGTYFLDVRPFSLKKGYTYHIKCEKIIENAINCFVLNEYNKNLKNSAELYNYGYTTKKLTIPNSTGIVDKECMMPKRYDGDGYTFTVKAEGLYLYQAVNESTKNTDEFYVGYAPNILNEEYKKQTLSIPTPGGLPGIPVSSGGNYTDKDGQQWVCDEIDLARGERVQQTIKVVLDGSQKITLQKHLDFNRFAIGENDFPIPSGYAGFCSHFIVNPSPVTMNTIDGAICVYSTGNIYLRSDRFKSADELKSFLKENPVALEYCLAEPIRTPLPPETITAYKVLRTYSPTTTVINDAGAGMSVGYKKAK